MNDKNPIVKPSLTVSARIIGEQAYVLDPAKGQLERLNEVGSHTWALIEKGRYRLDALCASITEAFEVDEDTARKDLIEFIEILRGKRMIDLID